MTDYITSTMDAAVEHAWGNIVAAQGCLVGEHQRHLAELDTKLNLISQALSTAAMHPYHVGKFTNFLGQTKMQGEPLSVRAFLL